MLKGFSYCADLNARILILGSMPGVKSLADQEYYAHPRNVFWEYMEKMFGVSRTEPYEKRLKGLCSHNIALWDVLDQCQRQGSLDSAIKKENMKVNDFSSFFLHFQKVNTIFFNGKKAADLFEKHVKTDPDLMINHFHYTTLPSTSPANASIKYEEKLKQWMQVRDAVNLQKEI